MTILTSRASAAIAALGRDRLSLKSLVFWGTVWTVAAYGGDAVIRLASNFILARIFTSPEIFGVLTIASLVHIGLAMFSDLGLGVSIVRRKAGNDRAFLDTAWTIQVIRGFLLWMGACIITWPMAAAYGHPELMVVIPVTGLIAVIQGLQSTRMYTASRDLNLARITFLKVGESALRLVITVTWALIDPTVWAIVGGGLITATLHMSLTHLILPGLPNRPAWDPGAVRELIGFGKWVFISSTLTFLAIQSDKLLLGKLAGLGTLGVYAVAMPFAKIPHEVALMLAGSVLFPALASRERESRDRLRHTFEHARGVILPGALAASLGVAVVSPWFFSLYRPAYHDAIWIAPMLAAGLWFSVLQASSDRALLTVGTARPLAIANAAALAVMLTGCSVGLAWAGMPGFLVGVGLGCATSYFVVARALGRAGLPVLWRDLKYTGALALGLVIAFGPLWPLPAWAAPIVSVETSAVVLVVAFVFALVRVGRALTPDADRQAETASHPPADRSAPGAQRPEIAHRRARRTYDEPLRA